MELEQVFSEQPEKEVEAAPVVEATQVDEAKVDAPQEQTEAKPEVKVDATGRAHGPDGKFAPKGDTTAAAEQTVPMAALMEERRKRQLYEQQLQQLQRQTPEPQFWDDPEAAVNRIAETTQRNTKAIQLDMSEYMARQSHPDYEEKFHAFAELIKRPGMQYLQAEALQHPHPAMYVYETAKNYLEFQQVGSLDKVKEELRKQIEAEYEKRVQDAVQAELKKAASIPQTVSDINGASASGALRNPAWTGPTSLESIFSRG